MLRSMLFTVEELKPVFLFSKVVLLRGLIICSFK